jgi:hypothetical protein
MTDILSMRNDASETTRFRLAFEASRGAIDAVTDGELVPITLDLPSVTATVLGALPELRALVRELEKLPYTDAALVEKLEPYALALFEAHASYLDSARPVEPVSELVALATEARNLLYPDALALANRGLIGHGALVGYRGTPGYKILAVDVNLLCRAFRRHWDGVDGKTAVSLEEIDRAEMLAERLITAIGERAQSPASASAATRTRQRAFTLVVKTYDAIRRGVTYLRWSERDADVIAPSLYAGRGGGRRRGDTGAGETEASGQETEAGAPPAESAGGSRGGAQETRVTEPAGA